MFSNVGQIHHFRVVTPYWQFFCGFEFFQHEAPIDASTMTRWRKRIGPEGLEQMLKASVDVALDTGVAKASSLERITVDTTVQPSRTGAHLLLQT